MAGRGRVSDESGVAALRGRYGAAVHAFFMRRLPSRHEAEELTQELFANLLRRSALSSIRNIEGYIFYAATNLLRARARSAACRPEIVTEGFADAAGRLTDEMSPERILLGRESYALFVEALQALPERPRTIFILNRLEEMTGREIASRLGISVSLVEKELRRAIAFLKERLS